jgi:hypothetical protein
MSARGTGAWVRRIGTLTLLLPALVQAGCAFGPRALERTHGQYNEAVNQVYEEQLLLNLVHLRYNDHPSRLEVSSIAAQFELSGIAQAQPMFQVASAMDFVSAFTRILPAGQVQGADRPTLALAPADDKESVQRFLTPLTAENLLFFSQAGWPISTIFRLYVDTMNGVPNAPEASGPVRTIMPKFETFRHVTELLQFVQDQRYVTLAVDKTKVQIGSPLNGDGLTIDPVEAAKAGYEYRDGPENKYVLFKKEHKLVARLDAEAVQKPEVQELMHLLALQPELRQYELTVEPHETYGRPVASTLKALHVTPRSTIQALYYLSRGVDVPLEHAACGVAPVTVGPDGEVFDWTLVTQGLFLVRACKQHHRPEHAQVAVRYRGYWFYIDDRDQDTKATFSLVAHLVRLNVAERRAGGPVLTLPVSR